MGRSETGFLAANVVNQKEKIKELKRIKKITAPLAEAAIITVYRVNELIQPVLRASGGLWPASR